MRGVVGFGGRGISGFCRLICGFTGCAGCFWAFLLCMVWYKYTFCWRVGGFGLWELFLVRWIVGVCS